jgi:hypothetical protein
MLPALLLFVAQIQTAKIQYKDVPVLLMPYIGVAQSDFPGYITRIESETARRVREGEYEHLIYFVLQSRSFTRLPPIEPALSGRSPEAVARRFDDFLAAFGKSSTDPRMRYFQRAMQITRADLERAYARMMQFLHDKEESGKQDVYQSRGHSSDTRLASSFTVWNALSVLKAVDARLTVRRVLILGPGADFAPRTDFDGSVPPQSYQPYAISQALLSLGLSRNGELEVDCADVNDRVLQSISNRKPEIRFEPGTPEFIDYQRKLSSGGPLPVSISAVKLNAITERVTNKKYDLIVATNILLYFPPPQLALALANIRSMLAPGGYFIHNDLRPETETYTKTMGMTWVQVRRLLIAQGRKAPLFDTFSILRR